MEAEAPLIVYNVTYLVRSNGESRNVELKILAASLDEVVKKAQDNSQVATSGSNETAAVVGLESLYPVDVR